MFYSNSELIPFKVVYKMIIVCYYNDVVFHNFCVCILYVIKGNAIVEVSNCCERYFNAQCKTTMSLSEFLAYWKDCLTAECPDSNRCLYMKVKSYYTVI